MNNELKEFEEITEVFKVDGEVIFPTSAFGVVNVQIPFKKVRPQAKKWEYAHYGDSGMDVYSAVDVHLLPKQTYMIPTGIAVYVPNGLELQLRSTSGNAAKTSMRMANSVGTVDAGYTGEVCILVDNNGEETINITAGMKIAQAVLAPVMKAFLQEVSELPTTERSSKGFGETTGGVFNE